MTAISKNVYFDVFKLLLLISTIIHTIKTIKMKPLDVKSTSLGKYN